MSIDADHAGFLAECEIFGVKTNGAGSGVSGFGEVLVGQNIRPTTFSVVSSAWIKIQAGNAAAPPTPPLYTNYVPGDCYNWAWDATNARLVYLGDPGYQRVEGHLSLAIAPGGSPVPIYASILMNGDQSGVQNLLSNKALTLVNASPGVFVPVSVGGIEYFNPGDYVEPVVKNLTDTSGVVVQYMNIFAFGLGSFPGPLALTTILDDQENDILDNNNAELVGALNA